MMTEHQERLVSLLLGTFPNFQSGDAEAALTAYSMVITAADPRDVEPGIAMLISGDLPGFDGRFAPTSAQLARAIRIALERRVDREIAQRKALPAPKDDWVEPSPEAKARGGAILEGLARSLGAQMRTDEARAQEARRAFQNKVNLRFQPDTSSQAMAERLGLNITTFHSGDDDQYDLGQSGAA